MSAEVVAHVAASIGQHYEVTTRARHHDVLSDEPVYMGGTDKAPDPHELFLSAVASCKLITMRMYSDRKQWDTDGLGLALELFKEAEKTVIRQTISFPAHLTEEQQQRLTAVSHKCPVAKIVTGEVEIVDNAVEPATEKE